jgi:hypothetical protein
MIERKTVRIPKRLILSEGAPGAGILQCQEEDLMSTRPIEKHASSRGKAASIKPEVRAWIDNVIVPSLVEMWERCESSPGVCE